MSRERRRWDDYQLAFSEMLSATSTKHAPWYVIPADHKWFARICAGAVLAQSLIDIDPQYPAVSDDAVRALATAKQELEAEAPEGAAPDPFAAAHDGHQHHRSDGRAHGKGKGKRGQTLEERHDGSRGVVRKGSPRSETTVAHRSTL